MIRTRMKNPVSTTSTSLMTLSTGTLSVQSLASTIGQESSVAWIQLVWWTDSHLCVYKLPKNGFRSERLLPLATRDLRSPDTDELWWEGEHDSRNATSLLRVKSNVKHSYWSLSTSRETSRNPIVISGIWKKGGPLTNQEEPKFFFTFGKKFSKIKIGVGPLMNTAKILIAAPMKMAEIHPMAPLPWWA